MATTIEAQGGARLAAVDEHTSASLVVQPTASHPMPQLMSGVTQAHAAPASLAIQSNLAAGTLLATPDSSLDVLAFGRQAAQFTAPANQKPLVEPTDSFMAYINANLYLPQVEGPAIQVPGALPRRVDHRAWQTDFRVSQGGRGTCWAFAGCAALEAAYARQGIHVKLSEQYLFHISKAHENQRAGGGINSLIGFQGSADVVHHIKYWYLPIYDYGPYIDQGPLQQLADSIPGTGGGLANAAGGTLAQADWFEHDLRNIPLNASWFCQYSVDNFSVITNYTDNDLKKVLAAGYDAVIDVPGHTMVCYGYDDDLGVWLIKNSQALPGFQTMKYSGDPVFTLTRNAAYYITSVRAPQIQWGPLWVGRWEIDHDGWRGRLVIRRYLDIRAESGPPPASAPISLGTWYGLDGGVLPVSGGFVDGGRGLRCNIGTQPFEIYLHSSDPYRAAGRCLWNNIWFGVVMSRGTELGAGAAFDRSETIGLWDTVHDGWKGQVRVGVDASYKQAADGVARAAWIDAAPANALHQVDLHVDFGGDNRNQHFQLLHHTREDGLMGGVTQWSQRDWPVEARMSANFYVVRDDGTLNWYRHLGRYTRSFDWDPPKAVGTGWNGFHSMFGGGDGVIYAIRNDGVLLWYYHEGRNQGAFQWNGPKEVGTGWSQLSRVFAGPGGVIYAVKSNGDLVWYRHLGRRDGAFSWEGPYTVGSGWNAFTDVTGTPGGSIYALTPDGRLLWYRHYGLDHGYPVWVGAVQVGVGWQAFDRIWAAGNGFVYGRNRNGQLWVWRHHGFETGAGDWTSGVQVGTGWGGQGVRDVLLT